MMQYRDVIDTGSFSSEPCLLSAKGGVDFTTQSVEDCHAEYLERWAREHNTPPIIACRFVSFFGPLIGIPCIQSDGNCSVSQTIENRSCSIYVDNIVSASNISALLYLVPVPLWCCSTGLAQSRGVGLVLPFPLAHRWIECELRDCQACQLQISSPSADRSGILPCFQTNRRNEQMAVRGNVYASLVADIKNTSPTVTLRTRDWNLATITSFLVGSHFDRAAWTWQLSRNPTPRPPCLAPAFQSKAGFVLMTIYVLSSHRTSLNLRISTFSLVASFDIFASLPGCARVKTFQVVIRNPYATPKIVSTIPPRLL